MVVNKKSIEGLEKEISNLNKKKFFVIYESLWRLIFYSLIKGLASGLGWVLGATILVSLFTFMLSKFQFIPVLGEFISAIIQEVKSFDR